MEWVSTRESIRAKKWNGFPHDIKAVKLLSSSDAGSSLRIVDYAGPQRRFVGSRKSEQTCNEYGQYLGNLFQNYWGDYNLGIDFCKEILQSLLPA